jgi:hypothetical protein
VDTVIDDNDGKRNEAVSPEIAQQVRLALADLLAGAPAPPVLQGLPIELWLQRIVPTAVAAELLCLAPETVLKKFRDKLIELDGRKFGLRLRDVLMLDAGKKTRPRKIPP